MALILHEPAAGSMNHIHTFIELLIFFEMVDTGMHHNSPYPTLKCSFVLKGVDL